MTQFEFMGLRLECLWWVDPTQMCVFFSFLGVYLSVLSTSLNYAVCSFKKYYYLYTLQLFVWGTDGWEKQKNRFLQIPAGRTPATVSETRVQFHQDQMHFLAVHETQLAIYETMKLECVKQVFFPCLKLWENSVGFLSLFFLTMFV